MRVHEFPLAFLVVDPGSAGERTLPIHDRLCVGRECPGVDPSSRLLVDDERVSRNHFEIRVDEQRNCAFLVDSSTNGTRLNGARVERAMPVQLRPGDRIAVGKKELEFRSDKLIGTNAGAASRTVANISLTRMAMVVGDIIQYSTVSEYTETEVLMSNVGRLYGELYQLLNRHHGTVNNYVGDAFFAVWELDHNPDGVKEALDFALAASELVSELSPKLDLREPDGTPIRMGWAVAEGLVGVSTLTGMLVALGDATNLAFRLSGLAGRDGRAPVLATAAVQTATEDMFRFDQPEDVTVKGRKATERIYAAAPRSKSEV